MAEAFTAHPFHPNANIQCNDSDWQEMLDKWQQSERFRWYVKAHSRKRIGTVPLSPKGSFWTVTGPAWDCVKALC